MADWKISTPHIEAFVSPLGGMMAPVWFMLPNGRRVQPFKLTNWSDRPEAAAFPPVMRFLKGDFACVPYGAPAPPPTLEDRWTKLFKPHPAFTETHGVCANHPWSLMSQSDDNLAIGIDYPQAHPIRRVEKRIAFNDKALRVEVQLTIYARSAVRIACGVHPLFEIGDEGQGTAIETAFDFGRTFPGEYVPGAGRFASDQRFEQLNRVPSLNGGAIDASLLPFAKPSDDVLQLCGSDGSLCLRRPNAGYAVKMTWDAAQWPSCLLWIASGGRKAAPFDAQFRALAVEPIAAAFGIGSPISANPENPIAEEGVRTWIDLNPKAPWTTQYRIGVVPELTAN